VLAHVSARGQAPRRKRDVAYFVPERNVRGKTLNIAGRKTMARRIDHLLKIDAMLELEKPDEGTSPGCVLRPSVAQFNR